MFRVPILPKRHPVNVGCAGIEVVCIFFCFRVVFDAHVSICFSSYWVTVSTRSSSCSQSAKNVRMSKFGSFSLLFSSLLSGWGTKRTRALSRGRALLFWESEAWSSTGAFCDEMCWFWRFSAGVVTAIGGAGGAGRLAHWHIEWCRNLLLISREIG